ncbi:MAG: hypothetical protein ACRETU_11710 [Steroidobacterales bacterium]
MITRIIVAIALCTLAVASAAASEFSKVNGSVEVAAGRKVNDDVSTVNGSVSIGDGAAVDDASTVNGSIHLGPRASAHELSAVNGRLTLDQDSTVNGAVSNVNGDIRIAGAHVGGNIETYNGDIDVGANARIDGDIIVKKSRSSWFSFHEKAPRIVVGPGAVVNGTMRFEREVELYVSDKATIGAVVGATPKRFPGPTP